MHSSLIFIFCHLTGEESGEDNEKIYYDIIREVRNYVNLPISVKIGFYFSSLAQSVRKLSECGIKGLVLFNRPYNTDIDIDKIDLSHGPIYSTPEEFTHTLRWMSILSGNVGCDLQLQPEYLIIKPL